MRIMGIDPGLSTTGYGVIEVKNQILSCVHYGSKQSTSKIPLPEKLLAIHLEIKRVIDLYQPEFCAIENIYYHQNKRTAIVMGHARAVAMLAAVQNKMNIFEYSPREVKMSIVGSGGASKSQVQAMVKNLLHMSEIPSPDDAADALAVALCHHHRMKFQQLTRQNT